MKTTTIRAAIAATALFALGAAACAAGPRTTLEDFFTKHLDTSIPALSSIPAKMSAGDLAGAEKVFADHVRATLRNDVLNKDWLGRKYQDKELRALKLRAEAIMDYKLSSCGMPHHFADHKMDWHLNPTFNKYKEWTWQLSRHPFWTTLAEYYTATGDEKSVTVWIDMITSWFDQALVPEKAKPGDTHCWRTIEAGIRMTGWSRQIAAFAKSPQVTDEFLTRYFISIWEHGWRLRNNSTNGNWLLMELHGLLRISLLYPFLNDAPEWKAYALSRLQGEFSRQVYPDGFQYELSTGYHGVVVSNYLDVFRLYEMLGLEKPEFIRTGLEKMFEMYMRLAMPTGVTPSLNDGSNVNVSLWCRKALTLYPQRSDFQWFATNGKKGAPPDYLSTVFPWAGAAVFRSSWEKDAVWGYMDGSPFGRAHQHEDKLNFLLTAYGKVMLTEGGNYLYDSSECRKYVLSTRAHNTIRIDGLDQNHRPYRWNDADINVKADVKFSTSPTRDWARSTYNNGYGPRHEPVVHDRTVAFFKKERGLAPFFVVIDRLTAPNDRPHAFEILWHLEECKLVIGKGLFSGDFGNGIGLAACVSDPSLNITDMKCRHKPYFQGWMPIWVGGPHEQRPIPTPVVQGKFSGAYRIVTVLYPYRDGNCPIKAVKASSNPASNDFTLVLADGTERTLSSAPCVDTLNGDAVNPAADRAALDLFAKHGVGATVPRPPHRKVQRARSFRPTRLHGNMV